MKKILRRIGIGLAIVLILLVIAGFALMHSGKSKATATVTVSGLIESAPSDSASLARGLHLSHTHVCRDCHGQSFEGKVFAEAPPFRIVAPNLTSGQGGVASRYRTIQDWDRAIRYGVRPDGTALLVMPSRAFHHLSDADAGALIALLQSLPPVDNVLPEREIKPLGQVLLATGGIDIASEVHTAPDRKPAPPYGATPEYGGYIVSNLCAYCHGEDLGGGPALDPSTPPPPSLAASSAWPLDAFATAIRTGVTPDGRQLNGLMMPLVSFSQFTDEEIQALHGYIQGHFATPM
jgi:cytochrome c553